MLDSAAVVEEDDTSATQASSGAESEADAGMAFEFDEPFQRRIVSLMCRDPQFAREVHGLIEPRYFASDSLATIADLASTFFETNKCPPGTLIPQVVKDAVVSKRIRKDMIPEIRDEVKRILTADLSGAAYIRDKVETFAKERAYEEAILQGADALSKRDFAKIDKLLKQAALVGANRGSIGYNYWERIDQRTQFREDVKAGRIVKTGISTGIPELDALLYHNGWGRKELSVMLGAAKAGKSMSLGEFGQHASLLGYNVIYFTCEVSEDIIAERLDARLTDTAIRALKDDPQLVAQKVRAAQAKAGHFEIREYPSGTLKVSESVRVLEEYKAKGILFDLIIWDYADIMSPERRSDDIKDDLRQIYIDLRGVAGIYGAAGLTATQTNRTGATKHTSSATDVAEDFNKVRTCDVMIAINATPDEIQTGEARLTIAASRNSAGNAAITIKQDRSKMQFAKKVLSVQAGGP